MKERRSIRKGCTGGAHKGLIGHLRKPFFCAATGIIIACIVASGTLVPSRVTAQDANLRVHVDDYSGSNGLLKITQVDGAPPELFVAIKNTAASWLPSWLPGEGPWQAIEVRSTGQIEVTPRSVEAELVGILPPGVTIFYSIHVEGPGEVVFISNMYEAKALILFAVTNLCRLIPVAGEDIASSWRLVAELVNTFDDLRAILSSLVEVTQPGIGWVERAKLVYGCAKDLVSLFSNDEFLIDLADFIWSKYSSTMIEAGYENVGAFAYALKKLFHLRAIVTVLSNCVQTLAYPLAAGFMSGWAKIEVVEEWSAEVDPRVSVSPSTGIAGTSFDVEWTGFTPSHGLTQHLQPKGESEPTLVVATTDSRGRATTPIDSENLYPTTYELWGIDNKSGTSSNVVEFEVTGDIDLSPYSVSFSPDSLPSGGRLSVTFAVKNSGSASSGSFSAWICASTSRYGTENVLAKVPFSSMPRGTSQVATVNVLVPASLAPGEYYITVYADAPDSGAVEESREDNNIGSSSPNGLLVANADQDVTLTLYVHETAAGLPIIVGAQVTGYDGAGDYFSQTTNSAGYVAITGVPGTWTFTAAKSGYGTSSWSQSIPSTCKKHVYIGHVTSTTQYNLSISSSSGGSVATPGEGTFTYDAGTPVSLLASPASGYQFVNWTGNVGTVGNVNAASTTITTNGDYSIKANFEAIPPGQHSLTTSSSSGGSVITPGEATYNYNAGTVVSLVATPASGYQFVNWIGDVGTIASVYAESTTITMNDDYSIAAIFELIPTTQYSLTTSSSSGGSVTTPGEGTFTYNAGTTVPLVASPASGYQFVNWIGDTGAIADVNAQSTTIEMNGDYSIAAIFELIPTTQYSLTTSSSYGGSVTTPGEGTFTYNAGTTVPLVASPASGYQFVNWIGDTGAIADVNAQSTTITMTGSYSIAAVFEEAGEDEVQIPDPNLKAGIREAIGKPSGPIYPSDLEGLTVLNAYSRGIVDLTGLEYCTNLASLRLDGNQISNISPLANLTSLTYLNLGTNQISNVSSLAALTGLTNLNLEGNQIGNLSPLANLISLAHLQLAYNQIGNLSPLANLTSLTYLGAAANQISSISPLANLTALTSLHLGQNQIVDISALANLTGLTALYLFNNQISDIEPLVDNPGLSAGDYVYLTFNPLSSTSIGTYIPQLQARGVTVYY